ncbi:unnamed protein product [Eruca vesicaria subsp. sativa]|uniref:BHLH domain-containing protein n=1 Tax=Eruca vesicaria subsp. sativa TaxID=29727 RepID=A0ABC8K2Q5_ERUVS|nr:unnamed protein product [Eruca vesicaria subsp. sativa]
MTEEFETAGICTGTWWSLPNGMFSDCSLHRCPEISMDFEGFEWQNNDNLDAKTYDKSHTSTLLRNTNLDYTSQVNPWNHYNQQEERFDPINSFLEELFDSSVKPELLESFHFFDDVISDESRTISVLDHEIGDKHEEELQAWKSLITCQVRKEKLGDRITALQQLVSPFGKTDTASVLHDAVEYIKFLHEQITVSTNPYLNSRGSGEQKQCSYNNTHVDEDSSLRQDLRSRGLCLMPISSTFSTSPPHIGLI